MGQDGFFAGRIRVLIVKTLRQGTGRIDDSLLGWGQGRVRLKPALLPPLATGTNEGNETITVVNEEGTKAAADANEGNEVVAVINAEGTEAAISFRRKLVYNQLFAASIINLFVMINIRTMYNVDSAKM